MLGEKPKLQCASLFELFWGCLVSVGQRLFGSPKIIMPRRCIADYRLVNPITKINQPTNFSIGMYAKNGKKFFIKTWTGRLKNMEYNTLINEYVLSTFIKGRLKNLHKHIKIKIPTPVEHISTKSSFSVVYEYISGPSLADLQLSQQIKVLTRTLSEFKILTKSMTKEELNSFPKRSKLFYLLALPIHVLISTLHDFELLPYVLVEAARSLRLYPSLKKTPLTLAHRDLIPENIILHKEHPYLIDCGSFVLTHPDYDLAYLAVRPLSTELYLMISRQTSHYVRKFFKAFINVQFAQAHQFERKMYISTIGGFNYAK